MSDEISTFATMTDGQLIVGQTGTSPLAKTVSGDATMAASGALSVTKLAGDSYIDILYYMQALPNAAFRRIFAAVNTGDTDLYTCPANKRAILWGGQVYNSSAGNITWFAQVKLGGTYYRLTANATPTTATQGNITQVCFILEAGEIAAINTATNNGLNVMWGAIEFDATAKVRTVYKVGLSTGDNTLYTCPASTTAWIMAGDSSGAGFSQGRLTFVSDAGGSRNWKAYHVPSGGASGSTNQIVPTTAIGASVRTAVSYSGGAMVAGDFIVANVDTGAAAQLAWVIVLEIPT